MITQETLLELNEFIHGNNFKYEYHMNHIQLVREYAYVLNEKLGKPCDDEKLALAALAHDLFKDRALNPLAGEKKWNEIIIPQNNNFYVRKNLDILDTFNIGDYFNTDIQLHPLAAGIFLNKELELDDIEVLYPIFFHSCPILPVYLELPENIRTMVDIITLSDKLSSNYLRINKFDRAVRIDLDLAVFGPSGKEFNYTLGLLLARLISQGKSNEKYSKLMTNYYYEKLKEVNPFVPRTATINKLGGSKKWQLRKSLVLPTQYSDLKM